MTRLLIQNLKHPKSLLLTALLTLILSVFVNACSVYKSQGRSQFESAVPGKLQVLSLKDSTLEDLSENQKECWLQPANEALWHMADQNHKLSVKSVSVKTLEVCEVSP